MRRLLGSPDAAAARAMEMGGRIERGWRAAAGAERWAVVLRRARRDGLGGCGRCGLVGGGARPGEREGGGCGLEAAALALEKGKAAGAAWRVAALAVDSGEAGLAMSIWGFSMSI
jgi:hypothetical protein